MRRCPGCGVELPPLDWELDDLRFTASPECWQLYGEVGSYAAQHPGELGQWQQTSVDCYAAQHGGPRTPAINTTFALNGLYLVFERGLTGIQVRRAHAYLAETVDSWPRFARPDSVGQVTAFDVALASSPAEYIDKVKQWGKSVWSAWAHVHTQVAEMTDRQLAGWVSR